MRTRINLSIKRLLNNFTDYAITYGIAITSLLVIISFYLNTYDSTMVKITVFQIGALIVLSAWGIKAGESRFPSLSAEKKYLLFPALCFLGWGIISFALTPYKLTSLLEFSKRLLYVSLYSIIALNFDGQRRKVVLNFLIAATTIAVLYGLIQFIDQRFYKPGPPTVGIDKFVWRRAFGQRVFSTFGNPSMYGGFLLVMIPTVLYRFFIALGRTKFIYGCLIILMAFNIYWSGAYWMMSGLGLALLSLAIFIFGRKEVRVGRGKKLFLLVLTILTIAAVSISAYKFWFSGSRQNYKWRVATWSATVEMITRRPFLGWGIGSFYIAYPEFRRPEIFILEGKHNTETDHPESELLELTSEEGIVGLAIFLWFILRFFSSAFRKIFKDQSESSEKIELMALTSALLGFFVAICYSNLSYRYVSAGFVTWIFLGLASNNIILDGNASPEIVFEGDDSEKGRHHIAITWMLKILLAYSIAVVGIMILKDFDYAQGREALSNPNMVLHFVISWLLFALLWFLGIGSFLMLCWFSSRWYSVLYLGLTLFFMAYLWQWFMADIYHNRAIFWSKQGIWSRSEEFEPRLAGYPEEYQRMYQRTGGALEHYDAVIMNNPGFTMAHYFKGNIYNDWGSQYAEKTKEAFNRGEIAEAKKLLKRTDELWNESMSAYENTGKIAPNYVQMHHQVGRVHQMWGDFYHNLFTAAESKNQKALVMGFEDRAREHWLKALESYRRYHKIDPVLDQNYYRQAQIYIQMGEPDEAEKIYLGYVNLDKEIDFLFKDWAVNPEAWIILGDFYSSIHSIEKAESAYKRAIDLYPDNVQFRERLAEFYRLNDKPERLINEIRKIKSKETEK